jgi:hypothetical protein
MKFIPLNLQTLYADLEQSMPDGVAAATISRRLEGGRRRLYATIRDGSVKRQVYLGSVGEPSAEAKAEAHRRAAALARVRRNTVSILKRSGIPAPDLETGRLLEVLANAGLFDRGAVLIGTAAFQLYPMVVGSILPGGASMTQDADLAVTRFAVPQLASGEHLDAILKRADPTFAAHMKREDKLPKEFRSSRGFAVEVLTTLGRDHEPLQIKGLGCAAVPLRFLDYLIENPIDVVALYGPGVRVRVPQPARYAVHKLIVGQQRRSKSIKAEKDFWQARELIGVLRGREPDTLDDAISDAEAKGRTWRRFVRDGLEIVAQLDQA